MDTKTYEVRSNYAEEQDVLYSLAEADRKTVEAAIDSLAKDPMPKAFLAKSLGDGIAKMTVPIEDDEITVLYDVDFYGSTIDIVRIKSRGRFKKAARWLAGLLDFEPKGKR